MADLQDQFAYMSRKLLTIRNDIHTEEATKTALVMPFIQLVLGFDVFDVTEVIPEYTADVGMKKGEKVDFAIMRDDHVAILIECKKVGEELNIENSAQLFRYFSVTAARIAVLTNGNVYKFYTDLDAPNKMDDRPFLEIRLDSLDPTLAKEVGKLRKEEFDLDSILSTAEELKYVSGIRREFHKEYVEMSGELSTLMISRVYSGRLTARVREQLEPLAMKGFQRFIADQVNSRLQAALGSTETEEKATADANVTHLDSSIESVATDPLHETTAEEMEAYHIVRAIVAAEIDPSRIAIRDQKSYCAILVDDNNRKPLCRLLFNNLENLRIVVFDADKNQQQHSLSAPVEIHKLSDDLRVLARHYAD